MRSVDICVSRQRRFGVNWYAWTYAWWGSLVLAVIAPALLAHLVRSINAKAVQRGWSLVPVAFYRKPNVHDDVQAKLGSGIKNIDAAAAKALAFDVDHPVHIPLKVSSMKV